MFGTLDGKIPKAGVIVPITLAMIKPACPFDPTLKPSFSPKERIIGIKSTKRDLLSLICLNFNKTSNEIGSGFEFAEHNKLVDPYTYHPRAEQHSVIANYFIDYLKPHM